MDGNKVSELNSQVLGFQRLPSSFSPLVSSDITSTPSDCTVFTVSDFSTTGTSPCKSSREGFLRTYVCVLKEHLEIGLRS